MKSLVDASREHKSPDKSEKTISVIIPTYNNDGSIRKTIESLKNQTVLPDEIIVVDDSENDRTEKLINELSSLFDRDVLRHVYNPRQRSAAIARNVGAELARGDILLFLDDDVVLEKNYIEEIMKVYRSKKNVKGVEGYCPKNSTNKSTVKSTIKKWLSYIFFLDKPNPTRVELLPSTEETYPDNPPPDIINVDVMSGFNQSYLKDVFREIKFCEQLLGYSYKEDKDFSFQVSKKYPNSLFMTPYAKLRHEHRTGRRGGGFVTYYRVIYTIYFFYKHIDQTFKNKIIFLWSRIGKYLLWIISILKESEHKIRDLKYLVSANYLALQHLKQLKRGDLSFFHKFVEENEWERV